MAVRLRGSAHRAVESLYRGFQGSLFVALEKINIFTPITAHGIPVYVYDDG